jgi:hypothetical protein
VSQDCSLAKPDAGLDFKTELGCYLRAALQDCWDTMTNQPSRGTPHNAAMIEHKRLLDGEVVEALGFTG